MFSIEEEAMLVNDREDVIAVLHMRFGSPPPEVIEAIYKMSQLDQLERLILTAANAPNFRIFLEELGKTDQSFRIIGERFNPIGHLSRKDNEDGNEK